MGLEFVVLKMDKNMMLAGHEGIDNASSFVARERDYFLREPESREKPGGGEVAVSGYAYS